MPDEGEPASTVQSVLHVNRRVGELIDKLHLNDNEVFYPTTSAEHQKQVVTILDSGSSTHISGVRSDFRKIEKQPSVIIRGVDGVMNNGKPVGSRAEFKDNNFGARNGLYLPSFGNKRLVSTIDLNDDGWTITFGVNSKCKHKDGREQPIVRKDGLPTINFVINNKTKCASHVIVNMTEEQAEADADIEVEEELPKKLVEKEFKGRRPFPRLKVDTALDLHQRLAHCTVPGNEVDNCPACKAAKGGRKAVAKVRSRLYEAKEPLEQLNADFYGPTKTTSRTGARIILVVVDDASGFLWVRPLADKKAAPEAMTGIIDDINVKEATFEGQKIVFRVRTDNEPALRGTPWVKALSSRGVKDIHSTPYLPQQNGVVERTMRSMGEALRAILYGVGRAVWCYPASYYVYTRNRVQKRAYARLRWANDLSPLDVIHARREERRKERHTPGPVADDGLPRGVQIGEYGERYQEIGNENEIIDLGCDSDDDAINVNAPPFPRRAVYKVANTYEVKPTSHTHRENQVEQNLDGVEFEQPDSESLVNY